MQVWCEMPGLNSGPFHKLVSLSMEEVNGISSVAVECVEIRKNTDGEGSLLGTHRR